MIKRFKCRFILAAMASVFIVLAVILGIANVTNYRRIVKEADTTLTILMENFQNSQGIRKHRRIKRSQKIKMQKKKQVNRCHRNCLLSQDIFM